ncbi:hypothetical protein [Nocardioides pelophilus]|uniref:hypothetical protein n=1 Tax=Nocardioides pelophilus TaxID=2172019 RepID=UPI0016036C8B|nr:hypothetical protein [Nocardioides pelophilus]
MSEPRPQRVRVTGPPRYASGPRSRRGDVHDQTPLGDVFLRSLLKEQLALAIRVLALIGLTLGLLPIAFHLWPRMADAELIGLPVAWVVLGGLVYPFLLLVGWRYVRSVERNERDFADLVEGPPQ